MAKDAVISLRISLQEQTRLRSAAEERGTSVSEYVRSIVLREVNTVPDETVTLSSAAVKEDPFFWQFPNNTERPGRGFAWDAADGMLISGATMIVSQQVGEL